jgi:2-dehydro-3-deoxygalactonokinase
MSEDGRVLDTRRQPWGIRQLPDGGFAGALNTITRDWPDSPMIAAGMIGSRQGWCELPYVDAPAGVEEISASLGHIDIDAQRRLWIAPGLRDPNAPDVMRGEETQLIGALASDASLHANAHVVLPGTHSKWAHIRAGRITTFTTFMTGEIYALLLKHSILGAGVTDIIAPTDSDAAFIQGVTQARASAAAGALSRLFSTRAWMLEGRLALADVPAFLSGLLIGEEFRSALAGGLIHADSVLQLIGDATLSRRYSVAAQCFDLPPTRTLIDTAPAGLWQLAQRAGLLAAAATPSSLGASS